MQFEKIITALDLSEMDDTVLNYVKYFSGITEAKKAYFMHIIKNLTRPENVAIEFHQLIHPEVPIDEKLCQEMQTEVEKILPKKEGLSCAYEVHEGNPVEKMLHWAEVKNIDLVIFGRKKKSAGSGLTPRRMAHRLKSNILFVPEKYATPIQRVVVPLDYSEHSVRAIESALALRKKIPSLQIIALHVIEMMPVGYYPTNSAYQQYIGIMKEANMQSYERMLIERGIDEGALEKVFIENSPHTISRALNHYLKNNPTDLVIIGAQGHSNFRNFFYGSTTERFIDQYEDSPVLIIR